MSSNKTIFALRLKSLRNQSHMNQQNFCTQLSSFIGSNEKISVSAVSSWELGVKTPRSYETLIGIANFFNVSVDYLIGRDDNPSVTASTTYNIKDYILEIAPEKLIDYKDQPVFLVFNDFSLNRWGIYNASTDTFSCSQERVKNSPQLRYFALPPRNLPIERMKEQKLSMNEMLKTKAVWVDYFAGDSLVNANYTGWYKHSPTGELINAEGRILPYTGLDISFAAYKNQVT